MMGAARAGCRARQLADGSTVGSYGEVYGEDGDGGGELVGVGEEDEDERSLEELLQEFLDKEPLSGT